MNDDTLGPLLADLKRLSDVVICECVINYPGPNDLCEPHAIIFKALEWCSECGNFARVDGHDPDVECALPRGPGK